jgi:hypothetical protein
LLRSYDYIVSHYTLLVNGKRVTLYIILCYTVGMGTIGMSEAARRMGVAPNSARRSLQNAGVPLIVISARAYAVDEEVLAAFLKTRPEYKGRGRPPGAKNKSGPQD